MPRWRLASRSARVASARRSMGRGRSTPRKRCTRCASRRRSCATPWSSPTRAARRRRQRSYGRCAGRRTRSAACTICRCCSTTCRKWLPHRRRTLPTSDAGLAILARSIEDECRHLHGRYVAMLPALIEAAQTARRDTAVRLTVASRVRSARAAKMRCRPARRAASGQR